MTFCLICCCKVSFDSPFRACGSGGLANSLGGANCVQNTRSAFAVPRPSPSFPSLAVRSPASRRLQYARQLPVACSTLASFPSLAVHSPASRRLQYAYCKQREAGQGPGKEASSACCERLPEQQASCFTNPQHYCTAGNKRAASRR